MLHLLKLNGVPIQSSFMLLPASFHEKKVSLVDVIHVKGFRWFIFSTTVFLHLHFTFNLMKCTCVLFGT